MGNRGITFHLELHSLLRDIALNCWIIVLCILMAAMGCYVAGQTIWTPTYSCSATLIVRGSSNSSGYMASKSDKEKANMLATVLVQPTLKAKAAESLGMDDFDGTLSAYVYENTNFLVLNVSADTPEKAFKLIDSVIHVCPEFVKLIYTDLVMTMLKNPVMPTKAVGGVTFSRELAIIGAAALAGLGAIVALSILRDTVKDEETFRREIDAELLGTIEHERKKSTLKEKIKRKKRGLLLYESRHHTTLHFTESFQKLAMRLVYIKRGEGHNVFAVNSVSENEGKSTVAANIALALASRGQRVLLLDADTKRPALAKLFSLEIPDNAEFNRYLSGEIELDDLHFHRYRKSTLYMGMNSHAHRDVPDAQRNERLHALVEKYRNSVDFIIFDTAPISADSYVTNLSTFVDETIVVVRTDAAYCAAVNDAILSIKEVGGKVCGCVLNDLWPEFSLLGQMGVDETGYYGHRYSYGLRGYDKYSKYKRNAYNKYEKYDRYSKYTKYGKYSKYGKYAAYGYGDGYGKYSELDNPFEENESNTQEGEK